MSSPSTKKSQASVSLSTKVQEEIRSIAAREEASQATVIRRLVVRGLAVERVERRRNTSDEEA